MKYYLASIGPSFSNVQIEMPEEIPDPTKLVQVRRANGSPLRKPDGTPVMKPGKRKLVRAKGRTGSLHLRRGQFILSEDELNQVKEQRPDVYKLLRRFVSETQDPAIMENRRKAEREPKKSTPPAPPGPTAAATPAADPKPEPAARNRGRNR